MTSRMAGLRLVRLLLATCLPASLVMTTPLLAGAGSRAAAWTQWVSVKMLDSDAAPGVDEDRSQPSVSGNWAVWENVAPSGERDIYAKNIATGQEKVVCDAVGGQYRPQISGDWVVWSDERFGPGDLEICARNLRTNEERRVSNMPGDQDYADISGTKIVYADYETENIYLYDLLTGGISPLPTGDGADNFPAISGLRVAYQQESEIHVLDLTDMSTQRLTTNASQDTRPDIDGTVVAWQHYVDTTDVWDVLCKDLAGGAEKTALGGQYSQYYPRVDGTRITLQTFDGADFEIAVYDVTLDESVVLTDNDDSDNYPQMDGNNIVWANSGDIILGRLAGSELTCSVSDSTIAYGAKVTVSGYLTENGIAMGDREVKIDKSTDAGHSWTQAGMLLTDDAGKYSWTSGTHARKTYYRARYDGATYSFLMNTYIDSFSSLSPRRVVTPKAYLTKPACVSSVNDDVNFTISGYLKPKHTAGTKPVKVLCYRRVSGVWTLKKTVWATASDYSSYSRYRVTTNLPTPGSWRIKAYYPASTTNLATATAYKYVSVY